jgi:hypothetical protein
MDYSRYPPNWKEISLRIRTRDDWKCKFCGLANGAIGFRWAGNFVDCTHDKQPYDDYKRFHPRTKLIKIVLTVAHLGVQKLDGTLGDPHDKLDCRDENLAALCQRCHLKYDIKEHVKNAHQTRRNKLLKAGQAELFTTQ